MIQNLILPFSFFIHEIVNSCKSKSNFSAPFRSCEIQFKKEKKSLYYLAFALYSSIFLMWIAGLRASKSLHASLLSNILRGPMKFFEITPTGRLIARFSNDINILDDRMITNFKLFMATLFRVSLKKIELL